MYGEEADLCRRARALGARPRMTPEATIVHYVGASSQRRSDKDALVLKAKVTLARRYLPRLAAAAGAVPAAHVAAQPQARRRRSPPGSPAAPARAEAARRWGAVWAGARDWQDGFPALPHPAAGVERDRQRTADSRLRELRRTGRRRTRPRQRGRSTSPGSTSSGAPPRCGSSWASSIHYVPSPVFAPSWLKPLRLSRPGAPHPAHPASPPGRTWSGCSRPRPSCRTCCSRLRRLHARGSRIVVDGHNGALDPALVAPTRHGLGDEPLRAGAGAQRRDAPAWPRRSGCAPDEAPGARGSAAGARPARPRPRPTAARPTCSCPARSTPTSPDPGGARGGAAAAGGRLPDHRQPAQGRGRSASPATRPPTSSSPTTCRSRSSRAARRRGGGARPDQPEDCPAQRRQRGARRALRAGALGHPHPARDVRRGGALRANTPEGLAAALRDALARREELRGPQRGAEGAPAGGLARRGRRGGAAGRIRLLPGRTAGPRGSGSREGHPMQITPVILCGGSGTRLWPLSRASYPKQFGRLLGGDRACSRRRCAAARAGVRAAAGGDRARVPLHRHRAARRIGRAPPARC